MCALYNQLVAAPLETRGYVYERVGKISLSALRLKTILEPKLSFTKMENYISYRELNGHITVLDKL